MAYSAYSAYFKGEEARALPHQWQRRAVLGALAKIGVLVVLTVVLLGFGQASLHRAAGSRAEAALSVGSPELRGVWITNVASSVLFTPWGVNRAMGQLAEMRFNTVYPVVWNRGKTYFPSSRLKRVTDQSMAPLLRWLHPFSDPLQEMIRLGHRHQIRVLPWFEYGFMVPLNAELVKRHPDWLTTRKNGSPLLTQSSFTEVELAPAETERAPSASDQPASGTPASELPSGAVQPQRSWLRPFAKLLNSGAPAQLGWLNPFHPQVQALILDLVDEVLSGYEADGIQFDDHFSLPVEFGYDDYTVSLYQAEHQGQAPPSNPADPDWMRWRADKLSRFVNILHARVKATCPSCQFSLSPNPAKFAYRFALQDWRSWVEHGWIDELVVQVYRDDLDQFEAELGKYPLQEARDRIPVSVGILTGTWRRPIAFEQIRQQVVSSRDRNFAGISFFYWDTLWSYFTPESPQQRRQKFRQLLAA